MTILHNELQPFLPDIDTTYLNSYEEVLGLWSDQFEILFSDNLPEDYTISIVPKPLEGSELELRIFRKNEEIDGDYEVVLQLFGKDEEVEYNLEEGMKTQMNLTVDLEGQNASVTGNIKNPVRARVVKGLESTVNFTGIVAPYEDAICAFVARHFQKPVNREVLTSTHKDSTLARNYTARGYTVEDEGEIDLDATLDITKQFV